MSENISEGIINNGPDNLGEALKLTVQDLIGLMPEIEAKFPKEDMPPNPSDIGPLTFSALRNVCEFKEVSSFEFPIEAIRLHVRYDVEEWKLHECTCNRKDPYV